MIRLILNKGEKYNLLTVDSFYEYRISGKDKKRLAYYKCICDCGKETIVNQNLLRQNRIKSCGCLKEGHHRNLKNQPSYNRKQPGEVGLNNLYRRYKYNAKERNYLFSLNKEEFKILTSTNCFYCNKPPKQVAKTYYNFTKYNSDYTYNGIDRIDSKKDYTIDNVVTCCLNCNIAKMDLTQNQFYDMIKNIYEYRIKKEQDKQ